MRSFSSCTGMTAPVVQRTCDTAITFVRGVTSATIASSACSGDLSITSATRTRAPDAKTGPARPKCSASVVTISSSGVSPSPASAMLQPSVVDDVRATCSARPTSSSAMRSRSRAAARPSSSMYGLPPRPSSTSRRACSAIASAVARASGPNVPALRYATRSSTGKERAGLGERHVTTILHGRVVGQQRAVSLAALVWPAVGAGRDGRDRARGSGRSRGPASRIPTRARDVVERARALVRHVEVAGDGDGLIRQGDAVNVRERAQQLGIGETLVGWIARRVQVRDEDRALPVGEAHDLANAPLLRPCESRGQPEPQPLLLRAAEAARIQDERVLIHDAEPRRDEDRVPLAGERRAQDAVVQRRQRAAELGVRRERPERRARSEHRDRGVAGPVADERQRPRRQLLQGDDVRIVR